MGADERVFAPQREAFPSLIVPEWIPPKKNESLAAYAARMAESLGDIGPCVIGGASFGGMVAVEMCRHLDAQACLLIGSVRAPEQLPKRIRRWRRHGRWVQRCPHYLCQGMVKAGLASSGRRSAPHVRGFLSQFVAADRAYIRWASLALLQWRDAYMPHCPVFHIHGDRDRILPVLLTDADEVVSGAGHVITLSHPDAVNEFIEKACRWAVDWVEKA